MSKPHASVLRWMIAGLAALAALAMAAAIPTPAGAADIELLRGFNLVAYSGATLPVSDALADSRDVVTSVWAYDATTQAWRGWHAALPPAAQSLTTLESGEAYFVYATNARGWTFPGTGSAAAAAVALAAGGNLLVYSGATGALPGVLGSAESAVGSIWAFDAVAQAWRSWNPSLPPALRAFSSLEAGGAYWVGADHSATWSMDGSSAPVSGPTVVYVPSEGADGGNIAVQITPPETPRYEAGAPAVVIVNSFISDPAPVFDTSLREMTTMGFAHVVFLWPGVGTGAARSDGTLDNGGADSILALRDVVRFVAGESPDADGRFINEILGITVLSDNVGLYAFSNPGIAAVNALALHRDALQSVRYFVGRENPTSDTTTAVEVGHFDGTTPVLNATYTYPADYDPRVLTPDYSVVGWDALNDAPYFDINGNGRPTPGVDYLLGDRVPSLYGKRCYSAALSLALRDNGALTDASWPADLCTPDEAASWWGYRATPNRYPLLAPRAGDLAVMLVFAARDHVQPALDGPHIHQAYDGFRVGAGLWVRLNPDAAYVSWVDSSFAGAADNPANTEPADWLTLQDWAYPGTPGHATIVPLAAIAEMADRTQTNTWTSDLSSVIVAAPAPVLGAP